MTNLIVKERSKNSLAKPPSSPIPLGLESNRKIREDVKIALNKYSSKLEIYFIRSLRDDFK